MTARSFPWFMVAIAVGARAPGQTVGSAIRPQQTIAIADDSGTRPGYAPRGIVPEFHVVQRGDTLWDITGYYFDNPWRWPQLWAMNPQITNPHWIFPDDQVRLLPPTMTGPASAPSPEQSLPTTLRTPARSVTPQTVFLRQQGWLDTVDARAAGTVVGSPDDQMLLAEGDQAYVEFPSGAPRIGQEYTFYQPGHEAARTGQAQNSAGHVVRILGTARVETWDPDRHVATVRITESLDTIERGERLAAIPRRLDVIPPATNAVDLRATIVATTQPRQIVGQNMVVYINRGAEDRIVRGNRLFVVRRGDAFRRTIDAPLAAGTAIDRDGDGRVDAPAGRDEQRSDSALPEEILGEVLVLELRAHTATALVTSSIVEVEVGDAVVMRRGY